MNKRYIHTTDIHNTTAANEVIPYLFRHLKHDRIIDVGCGIGTWLKVALDHGAKEIRGIDGDYIDKSLLLIDEEHMTYTDLQEPFTINQKFDLVICLEVAEHLPELSADSFVDSIQKLGDTILFSAAIPGQGGQNHLNEQWPGYWLEKFARYSYKPYDLIRSKYWDNPKIEWWYSQNMILFCRQELEGYEPKTDYHVHIHPGLFMQKLDTIKLLSEQKTRLEEELSALKGGRRGINEPIRYLKRAFLLKVVKRAK